MHEQSLMKNLFEKINTIFEQTGAKTIKKIHVKLGALSNISEAHFRTHFNAMASDSCAKNAELIVSKSSNIQDSDAQSIKLMSIEIPEE